MLSDCKLGSLPECSPGVITECLSAHMVQDVFQNSPLDAFNCLIVPVSVLCSPQEDDRASWEIELDEMSVGPGDDQDSEEYEDAYSQATWEDEFDGFFPEFYDQVQGDNGSIAAWEIECDDLLSDSQQSDIESDREI